MFEEILRNSKEIFEEVWENFYENLRKFLRKSEKYFYQGGGQP